jgi:hypothetical protein
VAVSSSLDTDSNDDDDDDDDCDDNHNACLLVLKRVGPTCETSVPYNGVVVVVVVGWRRLRPPPPPPRHVATRKARTTTSVLVITNTMAPPSSSTTTTLGRIIPSGTDTSYTWIWYSVAATQKVCVGSWKLTHPLIFSNTSTTEIGRLAGVGGCGYTFEYYSTTQVFTCLGTVYVLLELGTFYSGRRSSVHNHLCHNVWGALYMTRCIPSPTRVHVCSIQAEGALFDSTIVTK